MITIRDLARQLVDDLPLPVGKTLELVLRDIIALLDRPDRIAFSSLISGAQPGELLYDPNILGTILFSLSVFYNVSTAAKEPPLEPILPRMRALWPHIAKWATVLHPTQAVLLDLPGQGNVGKRDTGRDISAITQAYSIISQSDSVYVKPFLHAHREVVGQALELWLYFPRYIPASDPDATASVYDATLTVMLFYNMLVQPLSHPTADERALFIDELWRVTKGRRHALFRAIAPQNEFLLTLAPNPVVGSEVWTNQFGLLGMLVGVPDFLPSRIPQKAITSTIDAAKFWIKDRTMYDAAVGALKFVSALCCDASRDNRALVRAIDAGVLEPLHDLGCLNEAYDRELTFLVRTICAAQTQARVVRAVLRRYPKLPLLDLRFQPQRPMLAPPTWKDIILTQVRYQDVYLKNHKGRDWRRIMSCAATQGPHDKLHRVCPCAGVFYCSGSCQRLHWRIHRLACMADTGPLGFEGALSLSDALFIFAVLNAHLRERRSEIGTQLMRLLQRSQQQQQSVRMLAVLFDLSDVVPSGANFTTITTPHPRHEVYVPKESVMDEQVALSGNRGGFVIIQAMVRAGAMVRRFTMPFSCDLSFFL